MPPVTLNGVWGASSDNVFAVGDDGTLLRFDGAHWLIYFDARLDLMAVFGTAANNVWAVGKNGMAIRFDGSSWQSESADSRYYLNAVWIDPAGVVRAAGSAALPEGEPGSSPTSEAVVLRHAAAGAEGWTVEASFQQRGNAAFFDMSGSSATDIWAVGTNTPSGAAAAYGFIAHFDGTAWAPPPHPDDLFESRHFTGVAAATPDAGTAWFMGGTSGVRLDGASWMLLPPLAGAGSVHARGAAMYAVGTDGLVVRWTAATDWTVDHAPVAPPAVPAP